MKFHLGNADGDVTDSSVADWELRAAKQIVSLFLPCRGDAEIRPAPRGFSGSAVFQCRIDGQVYALKRWPSETKAARVDQVHDVMSGVRSKVSIVPALVESPLGCTRLGLDGYHYELQSWMPGEPFEMRDDSADAVGSAAAAVAAGAQAIAAFHDAALHWGAGDSPAPAVFRRLSRLEELQSELPAALERTAGGAPQLSATLAAAAEWLRNEGSGSLAAARRLLEPWAAEIVPTQTVMRDVHRRHIFFLHGKSSGLIDFDAVGIDSPAADLARWVNSFPVSSVGVPQLWPAAAEGYRRIRDISACELELAAAINEASTPLLLANWVTWIALKQRDFSACKDSVDRRVGELMRRMAPDIPLPAPAAEEHSK